MQTNKFFMSFAKQLLQVRPSFPRYAYRFTCLWGLLLLMPFDTFGTTATFSVMRDMMPEMFWGLLIYGIGLRLFLAHRSKSTRRIRDALMGTFVLWSFIAIMLLLANPQGTNIVVYPLFVFYIGREFCIYSIRYNILKEETELSDVAA